MKRRTKFVHFSKEKRFLFREREESYVMTAPRSGFQFHFRLCNDWSPALEPASTSGAPIDEDLTVEFSRRHRTSGQQLSTSWVLAEPHSQPIHHRHHAGKSYQSSVFHANGFPVMSTATTDPWAKSTYFGTKFLVFWRVPTPKADVQKV